MTIWDDLEQLETGEEAPSPFVVGYEHGWADCVDYLRDLISTMPAIDLAAVIAEPNAASPFVVAA